MSSDELIAISPLPEYAPDAIAGEVARANGIARYLGQILERNRSAPSMLFISKAGHFIEPTDPELGKDPELPLGSAFVHGGLLGLRVVRACVAKADFEQVIDIGASAARISIPEEAEDPAGMELRVANSFLDIGIEAYDTLEDRFGTLVSGWETELYDDDTRQHYFMHCGFGFPVALMELVREQNTLIRQARQFEWSEALKGLTQ